jgi:tetrapyrrole methylase family protein / MazG family protein
MVKPPENLEKFESFLEIVAALRGPDGCPWDKEQTHKTLTPYAIEEAHELAEAIERGDEREMVSELGDVLLQVVLHAEIGRQDGKFTIKDVIRAISEKMVRRHPHVFSDTQVSGSPDVLANWSKVKAAEKAEKAKGSASQAGAETQFDIPRALPALQRAHKIGDKTNRIGFDWPDAQGVLAKLDEEILETKEEMAKLKPGTPPSEDLKHALEHEIGDVLFSAAQLARHLGLDAEQSLRSANARFEKRYFTMRQTVSFEGRDWEKLSDEEKESAWQAAKRKTDG